MGKGFHSVKKVLIYRLGSIGDTVVALPCFNLVAKVYPNAERRVLTNFPNGDKVSPIDTVVGSMRLVHGYFKYPLQTRNPLVLYRLAREIRAWGPEVLIYLAAPRGRMTAIRDAFFFKACRIKKLFGVPWTKDLQKVRGPWRDGFWESEASRMARCVSELGDPRLADPSSWNLNLAPNEREKANAVLKNWQGRISFVAASIGTKADTKYWGKENWQALFERFSASRAGYGLVLIGSADEHTLSCQVGEHWDGSLLNLCGKVTPRVAAAVMQKALLFIGHDSGPMHLAAAVGTPCVAIFSARNKPGEWYPFGNQHRIFYNQTPCFGCRLVECPDFDKKCIRSITVDEVMRAMDAILKPNRKKPMGKTCGGRGGVVR